MSLSEFLTRPGAADTLKKVLKPAVGVYVLAALWFGGRAILLQRAASASAAAAKADVAQAVEGRQKLAKAAGGERKPSEDNGVIGAFQSMIQKQANIKACSVSEFQASPDAVPYLTAYKKDAKTGRWNQNDVVFSLKGRVPDIYQVLHTLSAQTIPFELCTLELTRDGVSANGTATVVARVQGRVLIRGAEAKS